MAAVKKLVAPAHKLSSSINRSSGFSRATVAIPTGLSLPTDVTGDTVSISDDIWLIYGPKRIGKTSLAAQFPGALLMAFEIASRSVHAKRVDCTSWEKFLGYVKLLMKEKHEFKTAIIDTGLEAYKMCLDFSCKKYGFDHPGGQNDYGASWSKVNDEFRKPFLELSAAGMNLVIVCHERLKENETRGGQKFDSVIPALSSQADEFFRAMVGNMVYYHMRGKERFIQIRGTDYIAAGVGGEEHFLTPSGEQVFAVPAGNSYQSAFYNIISAFNNEQEYTFADETQKYDEEKVQDSIRKHLRTAQKKAQRLTR